MLAHPNLVAQIQTRQIPIYRIIAQLCVFWIRIFLINGSIKSCNHENEDLSIDLDIPCTWSNSLILGARSLSKNISFNEDLPGSALITGILYERRKHVYLR